MTSSWVNSRASGFELASKVSNAGAAGCWLFCLFVVTARRRLFFPVRVLLLIAWHDEGLLLHMCFTHTGAWMGPQRGVFEDSSFLPNYILKFL